MLEEDCNACDSLQQLSALSGGSVFTDLKNTKKKTQNEMKTTENNDKPDDQAEQEVTRGPINFEELGNSTWNLIHTMAAYYPEQPSEAKQKATNQFIESLGEVYPCNFCARDWKDELKDVPPRVESRHEFSQWACEIHNVINEKLGKDIFPCSQVDKRWRFDPSEREKFYE